MVANFLGPYMHSGLGFQAAIEAPTFHSTRTPSSFWPRHSSPAGLVAEDWIAPEVLAGLRRRGDDPTVAGGWSLGRMSAVGIEPQSGSLQDAANPSRCPGVRRRPVTSVTQAQFLDC